MKRILLRDSSSGNTFALEGEGHEIVPNNNTVYIDRNGQTYDPAQKKVSLDDLPGEGVMQLPRTTWFGGVTWTA
jgi:hypothetical protein